MLNRQALKGLVKKTYRRLFYRIRPRRLRSALDEALAGLPEVLMVHSSLASCGHLTGGGMDLIKALSERCGTLVLPTHSYCYPETQAALAPVYDAQKTPSQVGVLTEMFRQLPGVVRSIHSTHSLAASGPLAEWICSGHHKNETPCGRGTPYDKMLEKRATVILFGVSSLYYTLFHTAEDAANSPFAYHPETRDRLRFIDNEGVEREMIGLRQSREPYRFIEAGEELLKLGLMRKTPLGQSSLLVIPDSLKVHEYLVSRLQEVPDFLRQRKI
ncbi:MAG: AAC(3) family N-acetyltransferase [Verrucomicrobia bacterium]|nr:AAC(3) family N-acetyltransferase [Verrucomicrobiota bacterium]